MRPYESVFIAAPTLSPDAQEKLVATFEEVIKEKGGTLVNTISWGRRTLAYEIKKFRDGVYTIFEFQGDGDVVKELERRFRLNDSVLKYLTIKQERKEKLLNKGATRRQAKAEARTKRKARAASSDRGGRPDRFRDREPRRRDNREG